RGGLPVRPVIEVPVGDQQPVLLQPRIQLAASDCSPLPLPAMPPVSAATTACEPHSLTLTTRTFGNAARSFPPPGYPNAAALAGVPGTSHSNPSMAISRQGPKNAP